MTATDIVVRELHTNADYTACVQLQKQTWGQQFSEIVPSAILRVAQKVGGVTAGAFDGDQLVGFVFGISGVEAGTPVHWSDMLAVSAEYRNRGIGELLKWYQRQTLMERGINRVYWTFDPLDAKNAYLNFVRLGVYAREYVPDMYGETDSPLHATGTDRLVVIWQLDSTRVAQRAQHQPFTPDQSDKQLEIPIDIHTLNEKDLTRARTWRENTRAQFLAALPEHVVTGFVRGETRGYYVLTLASNFST